MINQNNIQIYIHRRKDNDEIFYVGIGKNNRPHTSKNRSDQWHDVVNKYGYSVKILANNLSWKNACKLEISLIKKYGRKDLGLGNLVNKTDGGEGIMNMSEESRFKISIGNKGKIVSLKSREKMSESKKDSKNPFYGKIHNKETKQKISNKHIGKILCSEHKEKISLSNKGKIRSLEFINNSRKRMSGCKNPMFGKTISKEGRERISINSSKPVIDINNQIFDTLRQARKHYNMSKVGIKKELGKENSIFKFI